VDNLGMPADEQRRRTRRRAGAPEGPPRPRGQAENETPQPARTQHRRDHHERGMRDLVGAGQSQLGVSGALRGRDVNRPTDEDLAEAERDVVLVRRHWKPPA
jgi:hypothetical protein